jgi:large subunit ribosomal protein L24e
MTKCTFCGREEHAFRGVHFIKNTGVVLYFCSSKCRKNSEKLKRDKRKLKWTEAFHQTRDKTRVKDAAKKEAEAEKIKEEKKAVKKIK